MSDYFDVLSFKKTKTGKTFAVRLGSAKQSDNGNWNLYLDAMPAPVEGQYQLTIAPRRERDDGSAPF